MKKRWLTSALCVPLMAAQLWGADPASANPAAGDGPAPAGATPGDAPGDLQQLRDRIAKQEKEIKALQESMEQQKALLERALQQQQQQAAQPAVSSGALANASTSRSDAPVELIPTGNAVKPHVLFGRQNLQSQNPSPLSISIGNATFTPLGFVDATFYSRSSNVGSGIGTNFGGIPYNSSTTDHISEANFTAQNSRIGFRVDSEVLGGKALGYFEADFLGNAATNVFVTSNADTFRMRNVFVDYQKDGFEILGGQDWSMFTPNRRGLSPIPADIFYTQNEDTNYQVGLVWARQAQFRFIAHPNDNLAFGVSLENPQQYIGGGGGLSATAVTLPAATALSGLAGTQLNNATNTYSGANVMPDIIFKAAYDGHVGNDQILHIEAGGMVREFKDAFPTTTKPVAYLNDSATAASGEVNANLEVVKNFHIIANTFFGSGNGRYVFGLAPDLVVRANGSISPVHTYSTVDGFEVNLTKNTLFDAYYGAVYVGRDVAVDANGKTLIGYGFTGSSNSDNRTIQEGTLGLTRTFWKNPNYGALSLITQYSYLTRNPWYLATGAARETHTNMVWIDLRYTIP